MSRPSLQMTRGARYAVVFLFVLSVLLSAGSYTLAVSADRRELQSRASVTQLCQSGNEARAQQITLWTHLIAISTPPPHQAPAQKRQRAAAIASFLRYVRQVFAPRDCSARLGEPGMTREEAHKALDSVAGAMAARHGEQPDRLHQLTSHLATAHMAVDHLFDHAQNHEEG